MRETKPELSSNHVNRRSFMGGLGSLLAAASYSQSVSAEAASPVTTGDESATQTVSSPDGDIEVTIDISSGTPAYSVMFDGTTYVESSVLGFEFQNQQPFGAGNAAPGLTVTGSKSGTMTERWDPIWDQYDTVSEQYRYLRLGVAETAGPGRAANLEIRVFDDGLGFRFTFDEDFASNNGKTVITSENTQFNFAGDYTAWWISNEMVNPRFEQEYQETALSDVDAGTRTIRPNGNTLRNGAHTPFTVKADENAYLSVHEADLTDYATLSLAPQSADGGTEFAAELAPLPDGTKVSTEAPFATPWRTIQVGTNPGDLVESSLVPLLNDELDESVLPTVDGEPDTSWITPRKYVGIWWTMIAGNANWEYKSDAEIANNGNNPAAYIHGARTERMKRYMKFASENGIDSVLVEGWNQGWDSYPGSGTTMDFDASYPDFDLTEVTDYGQSLSSDVEMTAHNETGGNLVNYEDQILNDDIFEFYEDNHIRSIKNGYVNDAGMGHEGDGGTATINHHCQLAVNHHEVVAKEAAADRQLLERHEADKPTGKRRTYPNLAATETVRAQEFDGFSALGADISPDHHVTLPFTRMLAGPTSYQPGIFDITFNDETGGQIQTTRTKQLAMYPSYNAGIQMAADRIEAYLNPELEVGELLQAAAGELDGFITADNWRNAFGTNYVAVDPNRASSGSSVSWTVTDVPADGTYDLHLRYASDGEDNANRVLEAGETQATLRVNDSTKTINPAFTEYWDDWEVFTTQVELTEGENTIAVELHYDDTGETFSGDVGGFNLNTIAVTEHGGESPIPSEYTGYTPGRENFETEPEFEFIEQVPAGGWDDTLVVDAEIGEYIVTARRKGDDWFVGAMTNGDDRVVDIPLDFLNPGHRNQDDNPGRGPKHGAKGNGPKNGAPEKGPNKDTPGKGPHGPKYVANVYSDHEDAGLESNPTAVRNDVVSVTPSDTLVCSMVQSGGQAIHLSATDDPKAYPSYEEPSQTNYEIDIPDIVTVGEPFITVQGDNTGNLIGGEPLEVRVDGQTYDDALVRIPPESDGYTVTLSTAFDRRGEYTVAVGPIGFEDPLASKTVAVESELPLGERVARWDDPQGDDHGPGSYKYPQHSWFYDGAFDIRTFEIWETEERYQFLYTLHTEIQNSRGWPRGFSMQLPELYLRDPTAEGVPAATEARAGVHANLAEPYHYRFENIEGTTEVQPRLVNAAGETITEDVAVQTSPMIGGIMFDVPKDALGAIRDMEVCPLMLAEDDSVSDRTRDVVSTELWESTWRQDWRFAGGRDDNMDPNVIDMITPDEVSQSEALAYTAETQAEMPTVPVIEDKR